MAGEKRVRKVFDTKTTDLFHFDPEEILFPESRNGALVDERSTLPVLESLVLDVMVRGIVEPVVVAKGDEGRPELIDGRQRVKAAIEANRRLAAQGAKLVLVPAVYRRCDELGAYAAMISANEHRQADDAIGRAKKLERFLALGATEDDAAVAFGVTRSTIKNWLAMLDLGPAAKSALKDGKITPTAATQIAKLPKEKQAEALVAVMSKPRTTADGREKRPTVRETRAAVDATAGAAAPPAKARRMRGKAEIELVMAHRASELRKIDGITACRWVLGLELDELNMDNTDRG
jgi:ParB family transcriptional regulator, chromosome partitioning protein